jgi:chorismate mutase
MLVPVAVGVLAASGLTPAMADTGVSPAMAKPRAALAQSEKAVDSPRSLGELGPLTDLAIQRLLVSDQVAAAKFGTGQSIDDPAREQQELDQVRQDAMSLGIDPAATVQFFQDQITASKMVQEGLFKRWTAHPAEAPTTRPDLGTIRQQLDQITTEILQQLVSTQDIRHQTAACHVQLAEAKGSGETLNHFDGLHRHALEAALKSVCAPA